MIDLRMFAVGERVRIEVEVMGVRIIDGKPEYYLRNPQTGDNFDYRFHEDQVFPIEEKE